MLIKRPSKIIYVALVRSLKIFRLGQSAILVFVINLFFLKCPCL